jgi:hypothetical protein
MRIAPVLPLLLLWLLVTACGPGVEPPHLLYSADAQSLSNPFPDLRAPARPGFWKPFIPSKAVNTDLRNLLDGYSVALSQAEGIGNFNATLLPVSERLDRASIAGHFVRLMGSDVLEADLPAESSRDALLSEGATVPDDFPEYVFVRPTRALPENQSGMLVVKKGLRTESGVELGRGFDFDSDMQARCKAAAQVLGIDESEVLLALPLKAAPVTARFNTIRAALDALPAPVMTIGAHGMLQRDDGQYFDGTWTAQDADWSQLSPWLEKMSWATPASHVGSVVYGTLPSYDLREDGVWKDAWVQDPSSAPAVDLRFVITLPAGPTPQGGWPYVIGAHGINARNTTMVGAGDSFCLELAEMFSQAGIACVGIDAPSHGSRGNPFEFFEISDLRKARENFRQMVVDQMQLIRALPKDQFRSDAAYFGNSLGGIMGASTSSIDPRIHTSVLNVPGGGLSNILTGPQMRDRIGLLLAAKTNVTFDSPEYLGLFDFIRALAQVVIDPGDPINVGRALPAQTALLAQEALGDQTIPNFTTEELAGSMQLSASGSHALFHADPKAYLSAQKAAGYNGHGLMWEPEAGSLRAQAVKFLVSGGAVLSE